ncbi:N-terminal glutamine amidohydrolase-like protein [Drosera capensis]
MVLSAKLKTAGDAAKGVGGFLLIFFPDDSSTTTTSRKTILPYFSSAAAASSIKRTPRISKRTQLTLLLCTLLVFFSFLVFAFSNFDPNATMKKSRDYSNSKSVDGADTVAALQGLGTLYRRGTKAMNELIIGHAGVDVDEKELRSFMRALQLSGSLSRADLAFVFSTTAAAAAMGKVVKEESDAFLRLVELYAQSNRTSHDSTELTRLTRYVKTEKIEEGIERKEKEAIWGKGTTTRSTRWERLGESGELARASYGSVVGFEARELDPEDSLAGFVGDLLAVPMTLRRWACYTMLLGRVKRNFKQLALVDVKDMIIFGDPFARIQTLKSESVTFWDNPDVSLNKRGRKTRIFSSSDPKVVHPGIIAGGGRGVRRFAAAVLTEIVRASLERKGGKAKYSVVTDSMVVNQVARNSHILKNVEVVATTEAVEDPGSLVAAPPSLVASHGGVTVVQRGHRRYDLDLALKREVSRLHSSQKEANNGDGEYDSRDSAVRSHPFLLENVYLLCKKLITSGIADEKGSDLFVVFISNEKKRIPLWHQKASHRADGLHCGTIMSSAFSLPFNFLLPLASMWLMPSDLPFSSFQSIKDTFGLYMLRSFASDRRHMRDSSRNWTAEPPQYDPNVAQDGMIHNLNEYIEILGIDVSRIEHNLIKCSFQAKARCHWLIKAAVYTLPSTSKRRRQCK